MKFYSSKIAVSKPISLQEAAAKAKQQPQVRSLDEIIASTRQIKAAASNATVKTAAVQVKVAQEFAEAPAEPINPDPVAEVPPAPLAPPAPMGAAPVAPGIPPAPITAPNDPAGVPLPPEMSVPPAPPIGKAPLPPIGGPIPTPAPKATPAPIPMGDPLAADPLAAAAASKGQLKMAKSINFTAWPEEEKVVNHWKSFGSHEKCVAGVKGKTTNAATYCTLLEKAAEMATEQLVKKASAAKSVKEAGKADQSPAFKRFAKLTEKEQSFLRDFFSKIYGKEYVTALLGDY